LTVATTGASGAVFLRHLLLSVEADPRIEIVNFIPSDSALRVMAEELDIQGRANLLARILGKESRPSASATSASKISASKSSALKIDASKISASKISASKISASKINVSKIKEQSNADIGANVASGSYPTDAMVVLPCSVGTLARIAHGAASNLIERAADVCLKEKRPLVLCVRETPLNKIHIRNLYRAADAGATIFPLIPAFYYRPASLDDLAREFVYRVLAYLGLPQPDAFRWKS
jgi:4-hydroxy-3-polyprenylbenzoate decarboxylase